MKDMRSMIIFYYIKNDRIRITVEISVELDPEKDFEAKFFTHSFI